MTTKLSNKLLAGVRIDVLLGIVVGMVDHACVGLHCNPIGRVISVVTVGSLGNMLVVGVTVACVVGICGSNIVCVDARR